MSTAAYEALLREAQVLAAKVIDDDQEAIAAKPIKDKKQAIPALFRLHSKYSLLLKRLDDVYDQMYQPQKRKTVRLLLDACIGRLLELKSEMVELDLSDYNYSDNTLIEMHVTPHDVEIRVPQYYRRQRIAEAAVRRAGIEEMVKAAEQKRAEEEAWKKEEEEKENKPEELRSKMVLDAKEKPEEATKSEITLQEDTSSDDIDRPLTVADVVLLIQTHERARKARVVAAELRQVLRERKRFELKGKEKVDKDLINEAATKIQRCWRHHVFRKKKRYREIQEGIIIKMLYPPSISTKSREKAVQARHGRWKRQIEFENEFQQAMIDEKEKFLKTKGFWRMEDFIDEVRAWFFLWYHEVSVFPKYPTEAVGGCLAITEERVQTIEEYKVIQAEKEKLAAMTKEQRTKYQKQKEKEKKAEEKKMKDLQLKEQKDIEKKRKKEESMGYKLKPSKFLPVLESANEEYITVWSNRDESGNPEQRYYVDMVRLEKIKEAELEIRKIVDEMMVLELEILTDSIDKERARRSGKKWKKKKKKRKGKKGKRKGKGKTKDLTSNRSPLDLFVELYNNGIIRDYPETYLSDFFGDYVYHIDDLRTKKFQNPVNSLLDARSLVAEYVILPMGSPVVHRMAPLIRSVCIVGPPQMGKHTLANAICTEMGAMLFDLTPANVKGKYDGKAGLKMLVHLINKMSRIFQPSVLFMDGAEKPFYKKIPKAEKKDEPRRLKTQLKKIIKGIKPEDQVLLLGVTNQPWAARKPMIKLYNKVILIPNLDYGARFLLWQKLVMKYVGIDREIDVSALAKLSDGYPVSTIQHVVETVMTPRRILQQAKRQVTSAEFLEQLMEEPKPVDEKIMKKYVDFCAKTPLGRKRTTLLREEAELREAMASKKKKGKK